MKNPLNRRTLFELLVICIISLTPLLWFRPGMMMLGHDNVFPINPKVFLEGRLSTWADHGFGQNQSLIMGTIPIHAIDAIPSYFGFSTINSQKIVYVFWFLAMALAMYLLARVIDGGSTVFRLTMVIFYVFNFFILQGWWIGERTKFSAYAAFPLVLAVFIKVWRKEIGAIRGGVCVSLVLFLFNAGGLYGIPLYGGLFVALFAFFLFVLATSIGTKDGNPFWRIIRLSIVAIIGSGLMNAYFLLPAVSQVATRVSTTLSQNGGVSGLIEWATEISASTSFLNLMRMEGIAEWYDNPQHPYAKYYLTNPVLIAISFLWPLLVLLAVSRVKQADKRKFVLFFFFVYLLGLFFAAGTHPPLGFLYKLFLRYVPGFVIFRSPYFKFAPAIFISSAVLIAFLFDSIRGKWRRILCGGFITLILAYHFPYFAGNFFAWRQGFSTRLTVPSYISEFGQWANGQKKESGRILMVPPNNPQVSYSSYDWGYLSFQSLPTLMSNMPVVINNDRVTREENILIAALYDSLQKQNYGVFHKLASLLSVSSVLLQKDAADGNAATDAKAIRQYGTALINTDYFVPERTFGQWELYSIKDRHQPLFYTDDHMLSLTTDIDEFGSYYPYFSGSPTFVLAPDKSRLDAVRDAPSFMNDVFVPTCLNCPYRNLPVVQFPERSILPDSPFYTFILALERRKMAHITDPKSLIYANLGLTLKRISELNELIIHNKPMKRNFLDLLIAEIGVIKDQFNRMTSLEDKISVARDINHYLRAERSYLRPNLGSYVTRGEQAAFIGEVFFAISGVEQTIRPFIAVYEESSGRAYQVTIRNDGDFDLLLRRDSVNQMGKDIDSTVLTIDDGQPLHVAVSEISSGNAWLRFGKQRLFKGLHVLRLTLPQPANSTYELKEAITEFSKDGQNRCFTTKIRDFSPGSIYKADINYINNFSDNLLMFLWEDDGKKRRLIDAAKLNTSGLMDKLESIVKSPGQVESVELAFCAPNLTEEIIRKQFSVNIYEVLYPALLIVPTKLPVAVGNPVEYEKISPTKYRVRLADGTKRPAVIVFSGRFDEGWKLSGFEKTHFRANGFANGWVLTENNQKDLILEFQPQTYFRYGVLISVVFIGLGIAIVLFGKTYGK